VLRALVVAAAYCALGCPKSWVLTAYNNTGEDLALVLPDREIDWRSGTSVELNGVDATAPSDLHWLHEGEGGETQALKIRRRRVLLIFRSLHYRALPDQYVDYGGPQICQQLQLESDLSLYLIPTGSAVPLPSPPSQPPGYPLRPAER
jgi:hypothetical protein